VIRYGVCVEKLTCIWVENWRNDSIRVSSNLCVKISRSLLSNCHGFTLLNFMCGRKIKVPTSVSQQIRIFYQGSLDLYGRSLFSTAPPGRSTNLIQV